MKQSRFFLKPIFLIIFICASFNTFSQKLSKHEIGISLNNFQDFGFVYKKEIAANKLTRYRLALFDYQFRHNSINNHFTLVLSMAIGREHRKEINEKFYFIHGTESQTQISFLSISNERSKAQIQLALGYVLGFQYNLSKDFYLNIESIPSITGYFMTGRGRDYGLGLGFNSNALALSLVYKFSAY
ncbi:MAG TPA: hypothetical protein ENK52_04250 [Saprospiraceae bacterium]|nr:hypothetical protein [Saprospiraceae bacterium]